MSHNINAIITKRNSNVNTGSSAKQNFIILRNTKNNINIVKALNQPYAIVQTDYFGGCGTQSAKYVDGKIISNFSSINQALHLLGVKKDQDNDLFDSLGLGIFRSNDDILDNENF